MKWLSAILAVLEIVKYLLSRRAKAEAAAEALANAAKEALDDLRRLHQIRDEANRRFDDARAAGGVPADIKYRD